MFITCDLPWASILAASRPIPELPPVTIATLSVKRDIVTDGTAFKGW